MRSENETAAPRKASHGALVGGILALSALLAGTVIVGSVACSRDSLQKGLSGPVPSSPEELLAELKADKDRIDQSTDQMLRRIDAFNASRRPGERQIQFSEIFQEDLSPDQRDVLNSMLAEEKDVSYRALLENIIKDRDAIRGLQERVLHLEQTLPDKFALAKKGDTHHALAMDYLVHEMKLDEAKAKEVLKGVDQTDELLPGNKVWYFYDAERDVFRTYVTQGEAGMTPLVVRRAQKRQLLEKAKTLEESNARLEETRARLESDISRLNVDVASLTDQRASLQSEVASLLQNKADLETSVDRLSRDLAFRKNSLFYHAASERELKDSGVLTTVLKRVRDVKGIEFEQAMDLRHSTTITLDPQPFGLDRIKEVKVLPAIYQVGRDFTVETSEDGGSARLVILDPDIFRGKEVIVSVRG